MTSRRKFLKCAGIFAVAIAAFAGCAGPGLVEGPGSAEERPLRVAVFVDKGARNIGAFRWLEITARMRGAVATPVDGEAVRAGALDAADVFVMPGGSSVTEARMLGAEGRGKLKEFIRRVGGVPVRHAPARQALPRCVRKERRGTPAS